MRRGLALLGAATILVVAAPAGAGVGYQAMIDYPGSIARGTVTVRAHASGGIGGAEHAAYHVGGGWSEGAKVMMEATGDGRFESRSSPWSTDPLPNGTYRLEVRIWGDVPPYDAADPGTFARQAIDVHVDNAPPTPGGAEAAVGSSGVRLSWGRVASADRRDFAGYRVLRRAGADCSGGGYNHVADTSATAFTGDAAPGTYCYRVAALRTSPISGVIASAPSAPVKVTVRAPGSGGPAAPGTSASVDAGSVTGQGTARKPPAPPALGEGKLEVSDGAFRNRLPYGSTTITQGVDVEGSLEDTSQEAGYDPRRTPTLVAAGLILGVAALLLRRFLAGAPGR